MGSSVMTASLTAKRYGPATAILLNLKLTVQCFFARIFSCV
jgi:hypothetical protein